MWQSDFSGQKGEVVQMHQKAQREKKCDKEEKDRGEYFSHWARQHQITYSVRLRCRYAGKHQYTLSNC